MYTANKPIFEFLYRFIRENFSALPIADDDLVFYNFDSERPPVEDRIFNCFERGPFVLTTLSDRQYPASWLEFGHTTKVESDRSPEGYTYELCYEMPILVKGRQVGSKIEPSETFRSSSSKNRGVGDIVAEVIAKAWAELHLGLRSAGNFQFDNGDFRRVTGYSGKLPLNDVHWWVRDWSVRVGEDEVDKISEWDEVLDSDPRSRLKILSWDFVIFEQEGL